IPFRGNLLMQPMRFGGFWIDLSFQSPCGEVAFRGNAETKGAWFGLGFQSPFGESACLEYVNP
ncbi:MAG: hypothetical protein AAFN11_11635, partial [Chloroflexota bacterium]